MFPMFPSKHPQQWRGQHCLPPPPFSLRNLHLSLAVCHLLHSLKSFFHCYNMFQVWKCHLLHLLQTMNYGNDEEMECSKESMLSWILQSYTQTKKEGKLMHVFKNFILNTNIQGLVDAFLVHYYILQINKQNKFNVRICISSLFLPFYKWPNDQRKCNVRILESKFVPHINKQNKPIKMWGLTFLNPSLS